MKRRALFFFLPFRFARMLAPLIAAWPLATQAATTLYWDPGATPATPSGGAGVWDTVTANWSDLTVDGLWPNTNDTAVFGGTGGAVTVDAGGVNAGTLQFDVNGYTLSGGPITLGGTPTVSVTNASDTATVNSVLADGGLGLAKTGAGTLILGGANTTLTGAVSVTGGTLQISSSGNLGDSSVTNTIGLNGGTLKSTASVDLGVNRTIAIGASGGTLSVGPTNATTLTASGSLSGSGALGVTGGGVVILSADNSGFSGNVNVDSAGGTANTILRLSHNNALTSGTITVAQGTVAAGTGTSLDLSGVTISGTTLVLNSSATGNFRSALTASSGTNVWNGAVTLNGDGLDQFYSNSTLTVNGNVSGGGFTGTLFLRGTGTGTVAGQINLPTGNVSKTDGSTWTLSGTGNSWLNTTVAVGTLKVGSSSAIPATTALTIGQGDTNTPIFDLNGFDQTVASLALSTGASGSKTITNSIAGTKTFTVNNTGTSTFGNLGIIAGDLALSKTNTGTLVLGGANTYTGATTVNAGILSANSAAALGATSAGTTVIAGATLDLNAAAVGAEPVTLAGDGVGSAGALTATGTGSLSGAVTLTGASVTIGGSGALTLSSALDTGGTAGLTKVGSGSLILSAASTRTGTTTVNGGTLSIGNLSALGTSTVDVNTGGTLASSVAGTYGQTVNLNGGTLANTAAGTVTLATAGQLNATANSTINVSQTGPTGKILLSAPGVLVGSGNIAKTGPGTLQFTSANTGYTGALQVSGGQAELQNLQALGTTPSAITVDGTGEVVVTNNTWAGAITANGGAISGNSGNSTYNGPIAAGGNFAARARDFNATGTGRTLTISGLISGSGNLISQGPTGGTGRVLVTGANAGGWTGGLQVDVNTQAVASVGFGTGATTSIGSGDLTLNGGRLTLTPSVGSGLTTTAGVSGRWITNSALANDTFASQWNTAPTVATRIDAALNVPNQATIDPITGLPGTAGGGLNLAVPQGAGLAPNGAFIDRYAVAYNGLLNISGAGSYTFTVASDDGSSLFIDGQQVVTNEGAHGIGTITSGAVTLSSGLHQITVKNSNNGTGGGLQVAYQGPDQPVAPTLGTGITNMATTGVPASALSNVTGGLTYALTNNITVPNQGAATNTILETTGFDTNSAGNMTVGTNGNLVFASATSHSFTQNGPVTLGAGAGLTSQSTAVTVPITTTLTSAKTTINGAVTLTGNANLNADALGLLTVNGVIDDGASTFGITKNGGAGTVVIGGTAANTFDGAFNMAQGVLLLNKTANVNAIGAGGLNLDTSIATGTAAIDYAVVRLMANEQIANGSTLNVLTHNTVGYGATLDLNNFTETVGGVNVRGSTTNMGRIVTGPNGQLIVGGNITMSNNRNSTGNTGRESLITSVAPATNAVNITTYGGGNLNLGGVTRTITAQTTVNQASTDSTIDVAITNGGIIKEGGQRLTLNGSNPAAGSNSTFTGGVTLNNGVLRAGGAAAQTSSVLGTGTLTINKGLTTADQGIAANLPTLELRNNGPSMNLLQGGTVGANFVGQSVSNVVNYGNNVTVAAAVPVFGVDVNSTPQIITNSAGTNLGTPVGSGAELRMGTLTSGAALQLNVTGGNNYSLAFNGLSLGGALTVNAIGANLRLNNLSGANNITTAATNTGNLIIGGNGAGYSGTVNVAAGGTIRLAPAIGVANNLFGTGTLTTAANPTIGISPVMEGATLTAGTPGGLTARFYQTGAAQVINTSGAYAQVPSGVLTVPLLSDGAIANRPPTVTGASFTNDIAVYSGLLNITAAGSYTFQTYVDDQSQLVIDGMPVVSVNAGGGGTGVIHSPVSAPITLSAGLHTIAFKLSNGGSGGGFGVSYSGADSGGVMRPIPSSALQSAGLLSNVANSGLNQTIAAGASLTLDGGGTDLDGGINNLTFSGATGTLNVTNAGGIGITTVSGTTSFGANTPTFNPTTGVLGLIGDVSGSGAITKNGAGMIIMAGAKTFTGALNITAGGVQVTNPASLGTVAGATVLTAGAVLDLNGVALGAEPITLNGTGVANITPAALWNSSSAAASASGPITLGSNTAIGGLGDINLTGPQTGNFTLQKIGPGTLTLSGASTNTAGYTISSGFLKVNNATALGTTAGTTTTSGGGVLDLNGFSLAEPLNLTGAGTTNYGSMNSLGTLINTGAAVTHTGTVVLGGASSIGSSSLGAGGDITFGSTAIISAAQALTKVGGNTVTFQAVNTYTGNTNVNLGSLVMNGAGSIATGNTLTINPTATVTLDSAGTNTNNRLGGGKAVNLVGGNLNLTGNAGAATSEALGANNLTANSNHSVVTLTPNAAQSLTLSSTNTLARSANGTILFRGTNLGNPAAANTAVVTFNATENTIGQFGAAGSKNRAILPWAIVDTSATGDGSSFAAFSASGQLQPLNPASELDIDTITGPNNIAAATTALAVPSGGTLINSLMVTGTGSVAIAGGGNLQLDSGAFGANATGTISGGILNAGITQSNNLREIIAYTSGAGTNLTVSSVLASNIAGVNAIGPNASPNLAPSVGSATISRGGLTKAGQGTLTLNAPTLFFGTTRLNGGTTVLNGGDNTLLHPGVQAPLPGSLGGFLNAGALVVNAGATLDLNGTAQRVGSLASNLTAGSSALPGQGGVITNNSTTSAATLYISQGGTFTAPVSINHSSVVGAQNLNVQRDGGFTLTLTAPNTYKGTTTINGGLTVLQDGATLSGTSALTLNRAALRIDDSQTIQTLNRIPNNIPINLNGGAMTFIGRGGGTQNVYNFANGAGGSITIGSGPALLQAQIVGQSNANSAGDVRVNVGNINRSAGSGTLSFNFIQNGAQNMGDNPRFYLSTLNGGALPAAGTMLPAWITVAGQNPASAVGGTSGTVNNIQQNTTDFAQYDPATGLRPVLYTSVLAPGNNVNIGQTTTLPIGDTVINSLRLEGATTLIYGDAGYDTLNLQSGGLLSTSNANNRIIGTERNAGRLTAGGVAPGAPQELFIYNSANTLTVNAKIVNNPDGSPVSLVLSGASLGGTISLNGTNTYTGTTYVNGVNLTLNNTVGAAIPGDVVASGGTSNAGDSQGVGSQTITFNASNQIASTATVTLNGGTRMNLNNNSNTLTNLVFAADGGSNGNQGPSVSTGSGTLTLNGNVTATNMLQATTIPVMEGNLALPAGSHTFNIGTFAAAPGQTSFTLNSLLTGSGSLDKSGAGQLGIGSNNTGYTGAVNVSGGALAFTNNLAGLPNSTITLGASGTLNAGGFVGAVGSLAGTGTITSTFGNVAQYGGQVNTGTTNSNHSFGGLVTGVVAIGKVGTADFSLTNNANDFSGGLFINGGSFTLSGAGNNTTGTGGIRVNNTGTLNGAASVTGAMTFNPGSTTNFSLGIPSDPAPIINSGTVTSSGAATFNISGTSGAGTYKLVDYGGSALSAAQMAGIKLGSTPGGGLLYGLVNNAAGTSIDLSVEAVAASKTWSGHVNGTWDTSTNNFSLYNEGEQVVFTNAGYNKTITGGTRTPQAVTVANSGLCNDYSIANVIGGALAGGLNKSGSGLVQLTGNNTFGGAINVAGGTVRASLSSTSNSLGSGSVTLGSGTTLQLDPVANTGTQGITGRYFHQPNNPNTLANEFFQLPAVTTQTDAGINVTWTNTNRPANGLVGTVNGASWEGFAAQWIGKVQIPAAGPWSFFTNSDDATRVFIDGVQINNNDGGKGNFENGGTTFLTTGLHDIRMEFLQGTGGAQAGLSWQGPGVAKAFIPASSLFTAENVAGGFADNNINAGNNVTVSGNATINLNGSQFTSVQLGGLTLPASSTLNVNGNAGKLLRAGGTFLSGGSVTLNNRVDVNPGQITDGGIATTIIKQGAGRFVLDNTSPATTGQANVLSSGTVIEVQGGQLAVTGQNAAALPLNSSNPLGSAAVRLNGPGATLSLNTKQGAPTFDNAVTVSQSGTIEVGASSGLTTTLGGATNGITVQSGSTLTLNLMGGSRSNGNGANQAQATAGAALTLAGPITGTGHLLFRSPQNNMGTYPVYGTSTLTANNTIAGTTTVTGGYAFQNVTNPLIVTLNGGGRLSGSTGIVLNQAQMTVDDSATVTSGRIASGAPLTLRAGSFVLNTNGAASETLGTVTLDSGFNRIIETGSTAASVTGLLTGGSLVRNNRAAVQFQASTLGGAATNANLIKFTSAPALTGGGGAAASATISILPYAAGASNPGTNPPTYYPVTYDATNGIRPINAAGETVTVVGAAANTNTRDSIGAAFAPVPSTNAINSWTLDNSSNAGQTATLTTNPLLFNGAGAGLLLATATNGTQSALSISGTAINFQGAEGHIFVTNTAGLTINSIIQGTNGITVSGNNNINTNSLQQLSGGSLTLTGANTYTGTTTINGRLVINATTTDTPLGNAANPVQFGGGTLVFNNSGTTLASTRTVTMLPNTFGVIDTNGNTQTIAGPVTGSGGLVKVGGGRLILSNAASNYSGPTTIYQGDLTTTTGPQGNYTLSGNISNLTFSQTASGQYTGNIGGIGSLTITANAGNVITLGDPSDATKGVNTYAGGTTFGNANAVTLRGTTSSLVGGIVTQAGGIVTEQNFDGTASNVISGPATFLKSGTGAVTVVNASSYTGSTTISGGSLIAATDALASANGAFGNSAGAIVLGDAATTANNSAVGLYTGGAVNIGRPITIANQATTGGYTIGGTADANSTISGAITTNQSFSLTQVADTLTNALNITGGIASANAGGKTITMSGGKINILTTGISDGAGQISTIVSAGIVNNYATNTYTGSTTVNGGILYVDGSIASSSMTTVNNGGTLGGYGTVGSLTVNPGGTLAPGHSPGILNTGSVVTSAGSFTNIEIGGLTPGNAWTNHDQLRSTGTVGLGNGTLVISLVDGYVPADFDEFFIWLNDDTDGITGTFNGLAEGTLIPLDPYSAFRISYVANGDAGSVANDISLTYIPEPSTALLAGVAALASLNRRRRRAA